MRYKHTQTGWLIIITSALVAAYFIFISHIVITSTPIRQSLAITLFMIAILALLTSFSYLTVSVDEKKLHVKFGWGIYKTSFSLKEIKTAKVVKHNWYNGWGIRYWWWPKMTIYNVSGFDMVEITLRNGRVYRIGTDEAERLKRAIMK